jgi:adenylate cyclase
MAATIRWIEKGVEYELEDFNLIGRGSDASIRIPDNGVSRHHATIRRDGAQFWFADLGSANGSFVNEIGVSGTKVLEDGDLIQVGACKLIFEQTPHTATLLDDTGMTIQMSRTGVIPLKNYQATLLVADLRNFTALSAQIEPQKVGELLKEWYSKCEWIFKKYDATIDKFIGDGVFAYWLDDNEQTRWNATQSAIELSQKNPAMDSVTTWLQERYGLDIQCNVGLHTGVVAQGFMGRGISTAVGDAVNVTFRIESLTRELDTTVLASHEFVSSWVEAKSFFVPAGKHPLKGQSESLKVYKLHNPLIKQK